MPSHAPFDNRLNLKPTPAPVRNPFPWAQLLLLVLAIVAAGYCYYRLYWQYRLPQERVLTTSSGQTLSARIEKRTTGLLLLTPLPNGTKLWLPIDQLSPSDQSFVRSMAISPISYPIDVTFTDPAGGKGIVHLLGRSANLVKFVTATDGRSHLVFVKSLPNDDQALIQSFPNNIEEQFPLDDWPLTLKNGQSHLVRLTGRTKNAVQFVLPSSQDVYFYAINSLADPDQSLQLHGTNLLNRR